MHTQKDELLKNRLEQVIEFAYDGIYITDGEANTLRINKAYERITGLKRADMLGKNMRTLVEEGYVSESGSLMVLDTKKTISINQEFNTGKKALITSKPVFDDHGNIELIITNVRDITELYHLKEALEKNEKLAEHYYKQMKALNNQLLDTSEFRVEDKVMLDVLYMAKKVAATDMSMLLLGESGVGKELVAKFIHKNSHRHDKSFIKINCGAIPEHLIESELFGYVKGAFTGASEHGKMGMFELADKGTLFLDEIGELPLAMQVKLLRALQEGEITRVGSTQVKKVDVRVISATNRNLEMMVAQKQFREDLFYRLNVVPINIPPLRNRKDDIVALMRFFLDQINQKYNWNKKIDRKLIDAFCEYEWPGNVRELKNIIERIVVMSPNELLTCADLPAKLLQNIQSECFDKTQGETSLRAATESVERKMIEEAMQKHGTVRAAANALGIDASTLVRKRQKYEKNALQKRN